MPPRFLRASALSLLTLGLTMTLPTLPALARGTRLSEPTGGFSYLPPMGWKVRTYPGAKYQISYTQPDHVFAPNIRILDETAAVSLDRYVTGSLARIRQSHTEFRVLSRGAFVTAAGLHGARVVYNWTIVGKDVRQIVYCFPAPNNRKMIVTATWLQSDGNKYTQAVDASIKTFKLQ